MIGILSSTGSRPKTTRSIVIIADRIGGINLIS
jgi:hypothetical protein